MTWEYFCSNASVFFTWDMIDILLLFYSCYDMGIFLFECVGFSLTWDMIDILLLFYSNFCSLRTFIYCFFSCRILNQLSIKYKWLPKSTKIDAFGQKSRVPVS